MIEAPFILQRTPARKTFKVLLGHANHFLITILVGLEAVRAGQADLPPDFATSWNPKDMRRSADRSREFVMRGALTATIDALDAYARLLNRRPLALPDAVAKKFDERGRTHLSERLSLLASIPEQTPPATALCRFGVSWRNALVHYTAEESLDHAVRQQLEDAADDLSATYQGLSVTAMLDHFDRHEGKVPPSFKETTALVRAAQSYVQDVDAGILLTLRSDAYFLRWLQDHTHDADDRIARLWSKDPSGRRRRVVQLAREAGFTERYAAPAAMQSPLDAAHIDEIAAWSVNEARSALRSI